MASAIMTRGGGHVGALRFFLTKAAQVRRWCWRRPSSVSLPSPSSSAASCRSTPSSPSSATARPPHVYERVRQELGLDRPLIEQFVIYVKKAATGDFGNSVLTTNPVMTDIANAFPGDARARDARHPDRHARRHPARRSRRGEARQPRSTSSCASLGLVGYSVPIFWLGLMGLLLFYAKLGWVEGPGPPRRHLFLSSTRPSPASCSSTPLMQGQMGRVLERASRTSSCRPACSAISRSPISAA